MEEPKKGGLQQNITLCGNNAACPRCAAQAFVEQGWENPEDYKVAAAVALANIKQYNTINRGEADALLASMSEKGCAPFLLFVAKSLTGGLDKGISHYGRGRGCAQRTN